MEVFYPLNVGENLLQL